jgi:hypothetical protein
MERIEIAALVLLATIGVPACSRSDDAPVIAVTSTAEPPRDAVPAADRPPFALVDIGESARHLFDAAEAGNWSATASALQTIDRAKSDLPLPGRDEVVSQFEARLASLRGSVRTRDRIGTLMDANALTRMVAEISESFQTTVPFEAVLLGYYGRQLAVGIARGDQAMLARATADLRTVWNKFQATVERHGWIDEDRRFTDIVVQLEGATRPEEFVAPVRAELDEAERIEQRFR